jgi:hypothetical protein
MSVFSNPAHRSTEQAQSYTSAVLGLLGERDPFDVLRATPSELPRLVRELWLDQLSQPEAPGKWSITQVFQHLADSELVWGYRLRMVLAQDRPAITGYDQDLWADRLGYDEADPAVAIDDFTTLRNANLRLLSALPAEAFDRVGVHAERGEESVAHMVRLYAGHDLLHLNQIVRIKIAVNQTS